MKIIAIGVFMFLLSGLKAQVNSMVNLTPSAGDTLKLQPSGNYTVKPGKELASLFIKLPAGFSGAKISLEIDSPGLSAPPKFASYGAQILLPESAYYFGEPKYNCGFRHKLTIQWNNLLNKWY